MAPPVFPPNVLDFVLLFEHLLALCSKIGSISLMSSLLFLSHFRKGQLRVKKLSLTMKLYLSAHCLCSALGIPYIFYTLFWAIPNILSGSSNNNVPYYSPYWLFWTGILEVNYVTAAPSLVTFLAIERCLVLKAPTLNVSWPKKVIFGMGIFIFLSIWITIGAIYLRELPLQFDKISLCKVMSCTTLRTLSIHSVATKTCFGIINVLCCITFLLMLRSVGNGINLKNRVVKLTIFTEIFLNAMPASAVFLFNTTTGINLANYIGELGVTLSPVDAFICSLIYWKLLRKGKTDQKLIVVHPPIGTIEPAKTIH